MATSPLKTLLGHIHVSAERHETDDDLLARFVARRDEAAFELLVRRHGGMVLGVCRRVLPTPQDAEDAFQATFLVLARRADAVPPQKVGSWLHGVACRTAWASRRVILRRRGIGRQVSELPHPAAAPPEPGEDLRLLLDQELTRLPEKYRLPVILCDLEGVGRREAARRLSIPDGTLSNRLAEARRRLAWQLTRRGLALSGGMAALLVPEALARPPEALIAAAVSMAQGAAPPALVSLLPIASLIPGGVQSMWLSRLTIALGLMLSVVAGGFGLLRAPVSGPAPAVAAAEPSPDPVDEKALARSRETLREALKEFAAVTKDAAGLPYRFLADMGVLQARLGDRAAARKLFAQAGDLIAALDASGRSGEWRVLATAQARAGEADDAVATVRRIPAGDQYRDISFSEAATELAKLRREKDAIRLGEMVEGAERKGWVRPTVLQQVAVAHARAGDVPAALRVVERLTEPAEKVRALAGVVFGNLSFGETPHEPGIALIQFAAGKKDEARKTLQKAAELAATVKLKQGREWALTAVVCVQARMGEVAAARKTAAEVSEGPARPHVLAAIARAEGKAGRGKEALSEVERVKEAAVRAHVLIHLAAGQASGGDEKGATESFRRARAIIEKLPEGERHLPAHNLASAQGEAGDYRGALATVDAFRASEEGISGVNVAFSRAQAGDYAGALKIAEGMTRDRWWKGNLLRAIAQIQTQRRREKDARAWIGKLESPLERANALLGVAEALAGVKR